MNSCTRKWEDKPTKNIIQTEDECGLLDEELEDY